SPGKLVAVAGPSGCGKTTLLQILGLIDLVFDGELSFDGQDVRGLSAGERAHLRLARIGFVFQTGQLVDALTAMQNVALPCWRLRGRRRALERARELIETLQLEPCRDRLPKDLSAGELQRTAVARALSCDPSVVLADEPTANLDADGARRVVRA